MKQHIQEYRFLVHLLIPEKKYQLELENANMISNATTQLIMLYFLSVKTIFKINN